MACRSPSGVNSTGRPSTSTRRPKFIGSESSLFIKMLTPKGSSPPLYTVERHDAGKIY